MTTLLVTALLLVTSAFAREPEKKRVIEAGKKAVMKCPGRVESHFFCETETFDTPGVCGHGFECVSMKLGETQTKCDVEFECREAKPAAKAPSGPG